MTNTNRRIVLIDADSIVYILAWHAREHQEVDLMKKLVEEFMVGIIQATEATHYIGVFSPKTTFRHETATIKPYKGQRPDSPEWLTYWSPFIKQQCIEEYGFCSGVNIEADDVLSILRKGSQDGDEVVISSPDKDLRQIPGRHYNYSKKTWETISEEEADYIFWRQVVVGDTSDNITGIRGIGPKGADRLLVVPENKYQEAVEGAFQKVYNNEWLQYYQEIVSLVRLVQPTPELVEYYGSKIQAVGTDDRDEVAEILNHNNEDGVFRSNQRSHEDDLLRPPTDFSEQV